MDNQLNGIDPTATDAAYRDRHLDALSDQELFDQVAQIIAEPRDGPDSFELHAPLELMARRRLLPLVRPAARELARMQMVSIAARYQAMRESIPEPQDIPNLTSPAEATSLLQDAITQGDIERADALCVAICEQFDYRVLLDAIAGKTIWTLAVAAHAHIGVYKIAATWQELGHTALKLVRGIIRGIAQKPDFDIEDEYFDLLATDGGDPDLDPLAVERELGSGLSSLPTVERLGPGIAGNVQAGEQAGLLKDFLAKVPPMSAAKRHQVLQNLTLNTAAQSMIQEGTDHSKFGWTHCFTMPQAAWSLAPLLSERVQMPQVACSWVLGFQSTLSQVDFAYDYAPPRATGPLTDALATSTREAAAVAYHAPLQHHPDIITELATQASVRRDAHLNKYVRACIDATRMNPHRAGLYLAGAAYLTALWMDEHPQDGLVAVLNQG